MNNSTRDEVPLSAEEGTLVFLNWEETFQLELGGLQRRTPKSSQPHIQASLLFNQPS